MDFTGTSGLEWTILLQLCENIPHLCKKTRNEEWSTSNAHILNLDVVLYIHQYTFLDRHNVMPVSLTLVL